MIPRKAVLVLLLAAAAAIRSRSGFRSAIMPAMAARLSSSASNASKVGSLSSCMSLP